MAHKKRILTAILAGTMIASLAAGCSGGGGSSPSSGGAASPAAPGNAEAAAPSGDKPSGKIVVGGWPSGDTGFEAAMPGFNAEYPDIEVELKFQNGTDHHQQLATAVAAGSGAPDVAMIEGAWIGRYRDSGGFENLLDSPYNAGEFKDDFVEFKWNHATSSDGKQMIGLVWDIGPTTFFYRRDIFEEVGLPSEPEEVYQKISTYDGLLEVAEKVYVPNQRWLLANAFYCYTWNYINRDFYNEKLELQLDRPGTLEGLNAAITMRNNGWDAKMENNGTNEANAAYASGALVANVSGCWWGGMLKSYVAPDTAGKWGVTNMPAGIADTNWGGSFLALPSQSKNKEAAWAFMKYMMVTPQAQNEMFQAVDYFPGYKPAWDDPLYQEGDPFFADQKTKALWVDISKNIKPVFTTLMDQSTEAAMNTAVNTGLNEGKTAEEIVQMVRDQVAAETQQDREKNIDILKNAGLWQE